MLDRLIDLLQKADKKCNDTKQCENCVGFGKGAECVNYLIADHLLGNGVIVTPCKVGDTMYVNYKGKVYPVKVNAIRIDTKKNNHRICVWGTFHLYEYYSHEYKATFHFDSIGKSLFYTDSEAKMKGGAE